jgi:hypothetical protein
MLTFVFVEEADAPEVKEPKNVPSLSALKGIPGLEGIDFGDDEEEEEMELTDADMKDPELLKQFKSMGGEWDDDEDESAAQEEKPKPTPTPQVSAPKATAVPQKAAQPTPQPVAPKTTAAPKAASTPGTRFFLFCKLLTHQSAVKEAAAQKVIYETSVKVI